MRWTLLPLGLVLAACALFLRSYTLPPAPDRRGGTTLLLTWPNRPAFGSPRADCLTGPADQPVLPCLIASVAQARDGGYVLMQLPFCATCYDLSGRIAVMGQDAAATRARLEQIARFGW
ncbi:MULTISPECIES: hypothetical protein [Methylobacterium]|jgi:hypothetical protein|uniref:DUF2946 domain-containing protein n=1 Tax=Methylobacterium longum TaxID=767694 RepID=A0ABT8ASE0_9HYPH|nr:MULTISPECIES: hypothetical protein [Methylobacterium]MCJ2099132.1 hypothetical protein [Methylobacterium sp. E-046]MDN3572763.1 hypothetical protein [Methylobacterium longum]GJE10113.1 hypothetical protein FOHLNKBM_1145 [Methylobacterium longum]